MKFLGTLMLSIAILAPYFYYSGGILFISENSLSSLALGGGDLGPLNYLTHLFAHVGINHLLANMIPIILFGLVLERALAWFDVIGIFLVSGILSSALFSLMNPGAALVGASTGAAGLMASATFLKPKKSIILLLLVPVLLFGSAFAAEELATHEARSLSAQKAFFEEAVPSLQAEGKAVEAAEAQKQLETTEVKLEQSTEGVAREKVTGTDFLVHAFGAAFGLAFVFAFRRRKVDEGFEEFREIGFWIFENKLFSRKNNK